MDLVVNKSKLNGNVKIPGSKSHTVRAVIIASLANGISEILSPLDSLDTRAAINACKLFGAKISVEKGKWTVQGINGNPQIPEDVINVGNSGTTLYLAMGTAAVVDGTTIFTGDNQIRRRPASPLIDALNELGAKVKSTRNNGMAPIIIKGPANGGNIHLDGSRTSQYLSSLLINCPLLRNDTTIEVSNLAEKPYIEMTLKWLEEQNIKIDNNNFTTFHISGNQKYKPFSKEIPSDFSSATFFLCASAITKSKLTIDGLDMNDSQGDKAVVYMLEKMGCEIEIYNNSININCNSLQGDTFDLNDTPDALPALAVTACFADGETHLVNVAQARLKETDRISVMYNELKKAGADIEEMPDGLVIRKSKLKAANFNGHYDHRIVMALSLLGMALDGETKISTAEAVSVTFPEYVELMQSIGANLKLQ
ncbi:MAG: 3-phosphoshikimate 1-carboxyvinyltransferase [Armatimonadota bacterium]